VLAVHLQADFLKVFHLTMKKYWISFYFLAGLVQLSVWKDMVIAAIGLWPSVFVAIGYLLVLGMLGSLAARGVEAIGKLAPFKQKHREK
jgi:hypothetical protein